MKIIEAKAFNIHFKTVMIRDGEGHSHPSRTPHDGKTPVFVIACDDGTKGYAVSGRMDVPILNSVVAPAIMGEDPFNHELIWQRMRTWQRLHPTFNDRSLCALDLALWDICGKACGQPVYKMLGACRDKVPCYASIMVGDDLEGGLDSPRAYADYALTLVQQGYKAIKLHTWMPPIIPEPDPKMDVEACRLVREAVGPDIPLMLDPYHDYSRQQALYIAKELERMNYAWLEEPMDENSIDSFAWLSSKTSLSLCGPETAGGKLQNRAKWITSGAADLGRAGAEDMGGISPVVKAAHLYESFNMLVELHGGTIGNLHVMGAAANCRYYERGMLHPYLDYEKPKPWLKSIYDPMDEDGNVLLPQLPGVGWDLDLDYIESNIV